jgi:hypothetical protein
VPNHSDRSGVSGVNWKIGNANELKSYSEDMSVVLGSSYRNRHTGGNVSIEDSTCILEDGNLLMSSSECTATRIGASFENNGNDASSAKIQNVMLKSGKIIFLSPLRIDLVQYA